jgi:Tfp pilus assembly protein PilV
MRQRSLSAFSLVEVTLALGVAAFCLIAVFGLMPVGVQTNRNATSQTAATAIMTSVVSDMRITARLPARKRGILIAKADALETWRGQSAPTVPRGILLSKLAIS